MVLVTFQNSIILPSNQAVTHHHHVPNIIVRSIQIMSVKCTNFMTDNGMLLIANNVGRW